MYLDILIVFFTLAWFSCAKNPGSGDRSKDYLDKILNEVLASLKLEEHLNRRPRSNDTNVSTSSLPLTSTAPSSSSFFNYWLLPSVTMAKSTTTSGKKNHRLDHTTDSGPSRVEKLKDEIRYQALVKKTNQEFITYLNKIIEDKRIELSEEEKEIKEEYTELNRTRDALFHAYNKQVGDRSRLAELKKKLSEKQALYEELVSMKRIRRWASDKYPVFGTPWINIQYPGGIIRQTLRRKKSRYDYRSESDDDEFQNVQETTTLSLGKLLWKALSKYIPFKRRKSEIEEESIPLEIHYRVGKDVAHITIKMMGKEDVSTPTNIFYNLQNK